MTPLFRPTFFSLHTALALVVCAIFLTGCQPHVPGPEPSPTVITDGNGNASYMPSSTPPGNPTKKYGDNTLEVFRALHQLRAELFVIASHVPDNQQGALIPRAVRIEILGHVAHINDEVLPTISELSPSISGHDQGAIDTISERTSKELEILDGTGLLRFSAVAEFTAQLSTDIADYMDAAPLQKIVRDDHAQAAIALRLLDASVSAYDQAIAAEAGSTDPERIKDAYALADSAVDLVTTALSPSENNDDVPGLDSLQLKAADLEASSPLTATGTPARISLDDFDSRVNGIREVIARISNLDPEYY